MIRVTLEGQSEVLDLDEISQSGEGVEVLSGMLGLGLPPVEVQWLEGAGDGAHYRGTRVLPRDFDLPLHIFAGSRANLKNSIARIARVMSGKMTMKISDTTTGNYLWAEVYRVAGGAYSYGEDTNGEFEWSSTVTLRAGSPYFTSSVEIAGSATVSAAGTTQDRPLTIVNDGTAITYPVFEFPNTPNTVEIQLATTVAMHWTAPVNPIDGAGNPIPWDTMRVDMGTGAVEVVDSVTGNATSAYDGLGPNPYFFSLGNGTTPVSVVVTYAAEPALGSTVASFSYHPRDWMVI